MEHLVLALYFIIINCWLHLINCKTFEDELCFPVIGDIGGLPHAPFQTASQRKVARLLAKVTEKLKCKFVVGVGDNFYFNGVRDVSDPRFYWTFERTYSAPSLVIPWYMIAGNHDHVQNVSAQIKYSTVSDRWKYPDYYYSIVHPIPNSKKSLQLIMIDTTMLCWHNRKSGSPPPDVQFKWIEDKLRRSTADYLIVAGHHPILSGGSHGSTNCLKSRLKPLLEYYAVTAYLSGHDHNLQHIKEKDSPVHYFISGSGNFVDSRMTNKNILPKESLKFEHGLFGGFILARASNDSVELQFTNSQPKNLYKIKLKPRVLKMKTETKTDKKVVTRYASSMMKMPLLTVNALQAPKNPAEAVSFNAIKSTLPIMQSNIDNQLNQKVYWSTWILGTKSQQQQN